MNNHSGIIVITNIDTQVIELKEDRELTLDLLYEKLNCDTIEAVHIDVNNQYLIVVDDSGLLKYDNFVNKYHWNNHNHITERDFAGNIAIVKNVIDDEGVGNFGIMTPEEINSVLDNFIVYYEISRLR